MIAEGSKPTLGKRLLLGPELLEANDVWPSLGEPSHEVLQPLVDVVDVEGDDLHSSRLSSQNHWPSASVTTDNLSNWDELVFEFSRTTMWRWFTIHVFSTDRALWNLISILRRIIR